MVSTPLPSFAALRTSVRSPCSRWSRRPCHRSRALRTSVRSFAGRADSVSSAPAPTVPTADAKPTGRRGARRRLLPSQSPSRGQPDEPRLPAPRPRRAPQAARHANAVPLPVLREDAPRGRPGSRMPKLPFGEQGEQGRGSKLARGGAEMNPAASHCQRCGKPLIGTSGPMCGSCERTTQRANDDKLKRQQRAAREAEQKGEGGRPWRYFK